jgi:hypothetical protein
VELGEDVVKAMEYALGRAMHWQRPPHWSREDWKNELRAVANLAMCEALVDWQPVHGVPSTRYVYIKVVHYLRQMHQREWRFALRNCPADALEMRGGGDDLVPTEQGNIETMMLKKCLNALMLYYEQCTEREIASRLGVSAPYVHKVEARALKRLREMLGG